MTKTSSQPLTTEAAYNVVSPHLTDWLPNSLTENKGQYRISCGKHTGGETRDQLVPKIWMLGRDPWKAKLKAARIRQMWAYIVTASGQPAEWTGDYLNILDAIVQGDLSGVPLETNVTFAQFMSNYRYIASNYYREQAARVAPIRPFPDSLPDTPAPKPAAPAAPAVPSLTLDEVVKDYKQYLEDRAAGGLISKAYEDTQKHSMRRLLEHWDGSRSMASIGYDELGKLVAHFASRPDSKLGTKMAADTAVNTIKHIEDMFLYASRSEKWSAVPHWQRHFDVRISKIKTAIERKKSQGGQITFSPEQLKALWKAGKYREGQDQGRLYLLLGLNCCATQKQVAQLLLDDIHLDDEQPYIDFGRGKTGVYARYDLWPITVELLRRRLEKTPKDTKRNPEQLALLSEDGHALVRYSPSGVKVDSIIQTWNRMWVRSKLEGKRIGFKHLRKTTATAMRERGGEPIQQQALAHASSSMAWRHYTGKSDFATMNGHLRAWYYEVLAPLFVDSPQENRSNKSA